jgi:hypothetical protein
MNIVSNAASIQRAKNILSRIARSKVPEKGWTLVICIWEDRTLQLEYRHSNEQGIHRFFYKPSHQYIHYSIRSLKEMESSGEGKLEQAAVLHSEFINVKLWKKNKI